VKPIVLVDEDDDDNEPVWPTWAVGVLSEKHYNPLLASLGCGHLLQGCEAYPYRSRR
jgi:hypothetical protein